MIKDFMKFMKEQKVATLIVGFSLGASALTLVGTIVRGLIDPIISFIIGETALGQLDWTIISTDDRQLTIAWGSIVMALITFVATAFVVYWLIRKTGLDKDK